MCPATSRVDHQIFDPFYLLTFRRWITRHSYRIGTANAIEEANKLLYHRQQCTGAYAMP